jgi:hypothetical protein
VTTPSCVYSYSGNNILTALPRWLAKGFHKYADIIAVHGYQLPNNLPAAGIGPVFDKVNGLLANLKITLPVWDTEFGFGDPTLVKDPRQWVIDRCRCVYSKGIAVRHLVPGGQSDSRHAAPQGWHTDGRRPGVG